MSEPHRLQLLTDLWRGTRSMENKVKEQLELLAKTPDEIGRLVSDLPASSLVQRHSPEEFSVLESVCHLRDIEIEGYSIRIQRILTEDAPDLADVDGARLAIERDYNRQSLKEALTAFTSEREKNLNALNVATNADFARTGNLAGVGPVTLSRIVELMCEHDEGHLEELEVARRWILRGEAAE